MANKEWRTAFIVLVSLVAGAFLAGSGILPGARAQSEGRAGNIICVMGRDRNGYAPIVLVDGREQTVLVYEYSYANHRIELTSARTYEFDRLINEFNIEGITVKKVRQEVTQQR